MKQKKEITIYDIAEKLQLSSATVSRALNDNPLINKNTRKKIQDTAKELGYRHNSFARNLRAKNTHTIGIIMHELNSHFMTSVLAGIEKIAAAEGYDLIIAHSSENYHKEVANVQNLFNKRVDGLMASLAIDTTSLDHYLPFLEKGIPVIFYDRVDESSDFTNVIIDNYQCGYQATNHLVEQGCQHIALVTGGLNRNVYFKRYQGYIDALKNNGLEVNENLILIKENLTQRKGAEIAEKILDMKPLPDGIFFSHDFSAAMCMQVLKSKGWRIPEDIAVIGFNNDAICDLIEPKLSTINYPGNEVGEVAARTLINHLKGIADIAQMKTIIVRSELIIRESSLKKNPQTTHT
ncbi:LacI family DNA-binding transcriptional regulator [Olivibacter sitiensis]|uniref:LacI family DNA-binding transcriptional regulator n=1 Tax=Olivibacter sitiensis TaxID=376470 RepID=UPI000409AA72|nr:LacI family DNA-binding transcriptional regulator [Olivibacter sitiensis]